jgi:hypothetical protein
MILVFLIWVFLFFVLFVLGFSIVAVLCNIIGQKGNSQSVTLDEYFFIGLLSLSSVSGILSIWIPIGNKVFLFVIGLSLILFFFNFREIRSKVKSVIGELKLLKRSEAVFVLLIILFLLAVVVQKITWYDTGLYHAQSIQWIRKFAVVPGLGNIHGRLALNSMFLVISGLFTFQIKDVLIFPLNGICYIVLILKLFALIKAGFDNDTKWKAVFFSLIFLISLITMIPFLNSTSPDIICGILIVYAFVKLTSQSGEPGEFNYVKSMLLALVVFSCITYKISSLFLAITLLLNFRNEFLRRSLIIISIGILTLVPYIVRNYYLSGYLIYPFPSVDIFHPDWKIPFEKALSEKYWIVSWARIPGATYNEVLNMKMSEWILPWFKSNDFYNKLILIINSLSVFTFLSMLIKRDFQYAKIQVIIFINLIFWFMMAPDPRFAYGFLFIGFSLTIAYIIKIVEHLNPDGILRFLKIIIVCFFIVILGRRISLPLNILKHPSLSVIPAPFEKADTKVLTADFNYTVPVADDRCFYSDIPCVPFQLTNVKLRGHDLQDGFKVIEGNPK